MSQFDLLDPPVLQKFFTHKIPSTLPNWGAYLLEIADVFSLFDGKPYNRGHLEAEFATLSSRSPSARDPSDFRDEFGAYATHLGIFRVEQDGAGGFTCRLTEAARHLLCVPEPDIEAFCRVQLALFQYPLGHGLKYLQNSTAVQANARDDTVRQIRAGIRIVPLRHVLRALLAQVEVRGVNPEEAFVTYGELYALFNTPATCATPTPSDSDILKIIDRWRGQAQPAAPDILGRFSRNFHILEHTGLVRRWPPHQPRLLRLNLGSTKEESAARLAASRAVAGMDTFFKDFEQCTGAGITDCVVSVIKSGRWQQYFDGANLPAATLALLAPATDLAPAAPTAAAAPISTPQFPQLAETQPNTPPKPPVAPPLKPPADPEETRVRREKANRRHARIVYLLDSKARAAGLVPKDNDFIDLYCDFQGHGYIIEVKSCNPGNLLRQVRRGVSQLYEYRYRAKLPAARLWLVLEERPSGPHAWVEDYLVDDRQICLGWLEGHDTLRCHPACGADLSFACS